MKAFQLFMIAIVGGQKILTISDEATAATLAEELGITPEQLRDQWGLPSFKIKDAAGNTVDTHNPEHCIAALKQWLASYIKGETLKPNRIDLLLGTPKAEADFSDEDKALIAENADYIPRNNDGVLVRHFPTAFISSAKGWLANHLDTDEAQVGELFSGDYNEVIDSIDEAFKSFEAEQAKPAEIDPAALQEALVENQQPVAEGVPAEELAEEPVQTGEQPNAEAAGIPVEDEAVEEPSNLPAKPTVNILPAKTTEVLFDFVEKQLTTNEQLLESVVNGIKASNNNLRDMLAALRGAEVNV